jgi:hypothetical protein
MQSPNTVPGTCWVKMCFSRNPLLNLAIENTFSPMQFLKTPKKWLKINKKSQTCNDKKNRKGEENKGQ